MALSRYLPRSQGMGIMRSVLVLLLDLVVVVVAAVGAVMLRDNPDLWTQRFLGVTPYLVFALVAAVVVLPVTGVSRSLWHYSTLNDTLRIVLAAIVIVLAATSTAFAYNRLEGLARTIPILHALLIIIMMCALRAGAQVRHGLRLRPQITPTLGSTHKAESILLIGDNAIAELFMRSTHEFARDTIHVVGVLGTNHRHRGRKLHGAAILGQPEDLAQVLRQLEVHGIGVQRIVVAMTPSKLSPVACDALREVEDGTSIIVDYFAERLGFTERPPQGSPPERDAENDADADRLPSLRDLALSENLTRSYWRGKRLFDLVVAMVLLIVTAPVMLLVAVIVAIDVGAPVLFWQERPGRFGRRLRLYKFRTMRSAHDANGVRIAEARRLSRIGRFLRHSRLDELPQLFHILLGEMSFVGPRPLLSSEQSAAHAARLAVRPGLTGWAQVHGGRAVSVTDKVAMDLWYIRNASFRLDFLIALKTLRMVLFGEMTDERAIAAAWSDAEAWKAQLRAEGA